MRTFCITDFGARADGLLCTAAIQAAIDTCFLAGGGEVTVPSGEFLTATVRLRSRVTLHLLENACLKGSRDPEDYTAWTKDTLEPLTAEKQALCDAEAAGDPFTFNYVCVRWRNALIRAYRAKDIAILGESGAVIHGADCYDPHGEEGFRGPHAIGFEECDRVTLKGYTILHSANWAHCLFQCRDITVENIRVMGGHDGVHFRSCDRVWVKNSVFHTGDDCVAGFDNTDVTVEDCELNTACSAFRFGGTRVTVRRCRIFGPAEFMHRFSLTEEEKQHGATAAAAHHRRNMLSAFTYFADDSRMVREEPGAFTVEDCTVEHADRLLHYNYSGNEAYQKNRPLSDVHFRNVRAAGIKMPINLYGEQAHPVTATFDNVSVETEGDIPFMLAAHYARIVLNRVQHNGALRVRVWSDGVIEGDTPVAVEKATEPFFTEAI